MEKCAQIHLGKKNILQNIKKENGKMTQEQKVTRGTVIIFVLSIILVICLCVTATLAYFAGGQESNTTLILGGPVRVKMVNKNYFCLSKTKYFQNG